MLGQIGPTISLSFYLFILFIIIIPFILYIIQFYLFNFDKNLFKNKYKFIIIFGLPSLIYIIFHFYSLFSSLIIQIILFDIAIILRIYLLIIYGIDPDCITLIFIIPIFLFF